MLFGGSNISSELSLAMSLASAVDQLKDQQNRLKEQHDATTKKLELVRRMSRTNWLLVINLPLLFGVSKGQALQLVFDNLSYAKPLLDTERDLLAAVTLYVNRNGASCNMAFFVAQRHYDHIMDAESQKRLVASKQKVPGGYFKRTTAEHVFEVAGVVEKRIPIGSPHVHPINASEEAIIHCFIDTRYNV